MANTATVGFAFIMNRGAFSLYPGIYCYVGNDPGKLLTMKNLNATGYDSCVTPKDLGIGTGDSFSPAADILWGKQPHTSDTFAYDASSTNCVIVSFSGTTQNPKTAILGYNADGCPSESQLAELLSKHPELNSSEAE